MSSTRKVRTWSEVRSEIDVNQTKVEKLTKRYLAASRKARLEDLRKEKGLTQVSIAEILGIDQSRISRIERGSLNALELRTIQEYAEALGGQVELTLKVGSERITLIDKEESKARKSKVAKAHTRRRRVITKKPAKSH